MRDLRTGNLWNSYQQIINYQYIKVGTKNITLQKSYMYMYELLKAIDEKAVSLPVLLDMSKAFDSLNHNLL